MHGCNTQLARSTQATTIRRKNTTAAVGEIANTEMILMAAAATTTTMRTCGNSELRDGTPASTVDLTFMRLVPIQLMVLHMVSNQDQNKAASQPTN